jgi:hypothetical protein
LFYQSLSKHKTICHWYKNNLTSATYDNLGRRTSLANPDTGKTSEIQMHLGHGASEGCFLMGCGKPGG